MARLPRTRPPAPRATSRGVDGLARAYDFILEARFDQVDAELRRACGPAPPEACDVLAATALWWRILLDPESRALDASSPPRSIARSGRPRRGRTRSPDEAEAWFYLGGAYARPGAVAGAPRREARRRARRQEHQGRARTRGRARSQPGRRVLRHRAVPGTYADVAPAAAKFLRFFLLLPGGDRKEGLEQMLRARNRGTAAPGGSRLPAPRHLSLVRAANTARALRLLAGLHERYPANPLFLARIAEIQDEYQHDITASLATWRALLAAAREQRVNAPLLSEVQARLGIAAQLEALHQTDDAIEMLQRGRSRCDPSAPYGSLPLAHLRLGEAYDRIGCARRRR